MSAKPEILLAAHRIPYPPDKGDKIRSWRLLKHLAEQYDVHLACFVDEERDMAHAPFLRDLCASAAFIPINPVLSKIKSMTGFFTGDALSNAYYDNREMRAAIAKMRARPLAAEIAFSSTMAQYIATEIPGRKRIIDFCDADSEKWCEYADASGVPLRWVYAREGRLLAAAETAIANWADASFAVTAAEAGLFNQRSDLKNNVDWWSNGVDGFYFDPHTNHSRPENAGDVVFTGAMDYRANVEAVINFTTEVWPLVRERAPDATFAIVGSNPVDRIMSLNGMNGIVVTGRVDDVRPWLAHAKAIVAPLRVARGIQNKVLEAMAMAQPVIATPEAATGINAEHDRDLIIADGADAFSQAVVLLLTDDATRVRIGAAARATIIANYDWRRQLDRLDAVLSALAPAGYTSGSSSSSAAASSLSSLASDIR